jgi:hypothetical protein
MKHIEIQTYCAKTAPPIPSPTPNLAVSSSNPPHPIVKPSSTQPTTIPSSIPHLYTDQRIRRRSISHDPPIQKRQEGGVKKVVAFGRTTAVQVSVYGYIIIMFKLFQPATNSSRPSSVRQSFGGAVNHSENAKLRADIEQLKTRQLNAEKMRTEVDQLHKIMDGLLKKQVELQTSTDENQALRTEMQQLRATVTELQGNNAALTKRVDELEKSKENQREMPINLIHSDSFSNVRSKSNKTSSREVKKPNTPDMMFSCLPTTVNKQLKEISESFTKKLNENVFSENNVPPKNQQRRSAAPTKYVPKEYSRDERHQVWFP